MALNEKTSRTVATIASEIMKMNNPKTITDELWKEIQSVAASALTQTPDIKKGKIPVAIPGFDSNMLAAVGMTPLIEAMNKMKERNK